MFPPQRSRLKSCNSFQSHTEVPSITDLDWTWIERLWLTTTLDPKSCSHLSPYVFLLTNMGSRHPEVLAPCCLANWQWSNCHRPARATYSSETWDSRLESWDLKLEVRDLRLDSRLGKLKYITVPPSPLCILNTQRDYAHWSCLGMKSRFLSGQCACVRKG